MDQLEKRSDKIENEKMDMNLETEMETEIDTEVETNAFAITEQFKHKQSQDKEHGLPKKSALVGVTDKKVETKRILYFLAFCFGAAWITEIAVIVPMHKSGDADLVKEAMDMISQLMLTPAMAALVVRLATREGLVKSGFQFNFFEHKFLFLFGWFGMTVLTFLGAVIYFVIFRDNFDPNMTVFADSYSKSAAETGELIDTVNIVAAYKADLVIKGFTAAMLDFINSFGEEWGFRAYLLPKLYRKFGAVWAMLLSGLASGLWYAPIVAIGYYYGSGNVGFPVVNIMAMCIFGMVTGVIYAFLCLRTGSIFPAVFAHSAVNVLMSQAALFTFDGGNFFVGPSPTGILSGLPFLIAAVICLVHMHQYPITPSGE